MKRLKLQGVFLNTSTRPIWNNVFFLDKGDDSLEMWMEGDIIHILDKVSDKKAITHISQCWIQVDYDPNAPVVLEKKPRGRPKSVKGKPKVMN